MLLGFWILALHGVLLIEESACIREIRVGKHGKEIFECGMNILGVVRAKLF